jgi:hypothetical protein
MWKKTKEMPTTDRRIILKWSTENEVVTCRLDFLG